MNSIVIKDQSGLSKNEILDMLGIESIEVGCYVCTACISEQNGSKRGNYSIVIPVNIFHYPGNIVKILSTSQGSYQYINGDFEFTGSFPINISPLNEHVRTKDKPQLNFISLGSIAAASFFTYSYAILENRSPYDGAIVRRPIQNDNTLLGAYKTGFPVFPGNLNLNIKNLEMKGII